MNSTKDKFKSPHNKRLALRHAILLVTVCIALTVLCASRSFAGTLSRDVENAIAKSSKNEELAVIIRFEANHNLFPATSFSRHERLRQVIKNLKTHALQQQKNFINILNKTPYKLRIKCVKPFWIFNGIALTASADMIHLLAGLPFSFTITLDKTISAPYYPAEALAAPWNIRAIQAPSLWELGYQGQGVVVAIMDSGVDGDHPDLKSSYRGGANSWYDPYGEHITPFDADGHGTQVTGIVTGGDAVKAPLGVAPAAQWIAVKIFNDDGTATYSSIHDGFQWLLDPDGNIETHDAPDIVNNSWGLDNTGTCEDEFHDDIQALRAAGILPVFAAGNSGPGEDTSISPANNPGALAAGATDEQDNIELNGSRGPSACSGETYPALVAPGINIQTTDLSFGGNRLYATVSGSSFAAPHIAGCAALLMSAYSEINDTGVENAFKISALDLGETGPDNTYGSGRIDVLAAYAVLDEEGLNHIPVITSLPQTTTRVSSFYCYRVHATDPDDDALEYSLTTNIKGMFINKKTGLILWLPLIKKSGSHNVEIMVADGNGGVARQQFTITVCCRAKSNIIIKTQ